MIDDDGRWFSLYPRHHYEFNPDCNFVSRAKQVSPTMTMIFAERSCIRVICFMFYHNDLTDYEFYIYTASNTPSSIIHAVQYRVILKNVSFGISVSSWFLREKRILLSKANKVLSLSKFSWYLVIVQIIKIRHLKGHIRQFDFFLLGHLHSFLYLFLFIENLFKKHPISCTQFSWYLFSYHGCELDGLWDYKKRLSGTRL